MIIHRFSRRSSAASRYASGSIHKTYLYIKLICNPRVKPMGYTLILSISGFTDKPYVHAMVATSRTFFTARASGCDDVSSCPPRKKKRAASTRVAAPVESVREFPHLVRPRLPGRLVSTPCEAKCDIVMEPDGFWHLQCSAVQRNMNGPETRQVVIPGLVC